MGEPQLLAGWGRTPRSRADVRRPSLASEVELDDGPRGQLPRGLGRSYGDAALNAGGIVWDMTALTAVEVDVENALVRVGAGVSYGDLLEHCIPRGLFPPVTPGTKYVTIGGAVAADVHGKNHHRDGSIGRHVDSITMITGTGEVTVTHPGDDLFSATVGGMGLTGIILEVSLRMVRITSPLLAVDTFRTEDLAGTLAHMTTHDADYRYSVSWVDLAHGSRPGRGVVTLGEHATEGDLSTWKPSGRTTVPDLVPSGLVNRASVRAFNELWYRKAPKARTGEAQTIDQFFYPLDVAHEWNRVYGRAGFIQYQMVVPPGREDVIEETVTAFNTAPTPPSLVVLKRLGQGQGLLSFPISGWTLAVDFPAGDPRLGEVLDRIDRLVAEAGGRVYLAKDSRLDGSLLPAMYPELDTWRELADKADPMRRFRSDLDRRLALRGP